MGPAEALQDGAQAAAADAALRDIVERVRAARADGTRLDIRGGGSKAFYGHAREGEPLDVRGLRGIRSHEPSELVVTVRAGTPLAELEAALAEHGQWLAFEPPHFPPPASAVPGPAAVAAAGAAAGVAPQRGGGADAAAVHDPGAGGTGDPRAAAADDTGTAASAAATATAMSGAAAAPEPSVAPVPQPGATAAATVGGMVAAGLAGPARAAAGGVRDHLLGAVLVNGRGEVLSFGGTVMKNVAGYDVTRALAGSMGILGVIAEVSLKVLPRPAATATLRLECDQSQALQRLNAWGGQPLPLNASAWWDGTLVLRLAGAAAAVRAACRTLGGEAIDEPLAGGFWRGLRDHTDDYFEAAHAAVESGGATLWRLGVPSTAAPLALPGDTLVEWGGAQRWVCTDAPAAQVRRAAADAGGHAVLFRGADKSAGVWAPLPPPLMRIQRELKRAFDPDGVFNPGRLYAGL